MAQVRQQQLNVRVLEVRPLRWDPSSPEGACHACAMLTLPAHLGLWTEDVIKAAPFSEHLGINSACPLVFQNDRT